MPFKRIELHSSVSKPVILRTRLIFQRCCRDVYLNGFKIPKHTQIMPLLHAVHMDPKLWDEPEKFKPTRFLNAEGKVTKPEYFLPFGVGTYSFEMLHFLFPHKSVIFLGLCGSVRLLLHDLDVIILDDNAQIWRSVLYLLKNFIIVR